MFRRSPAERHIPVQADFFRHISAIVVVRNHGALPLGSRRQHRRIDVYTSGTKATKRKIKRPVVRIDIRNR